MIRVKKTQILKVNQTILAGNREHPAPTLSYAGKRDAKHIPIGQKSCNLNKLVGGKSAFLSRFYNLNKLLLATKVHSVKYVL